MEHSNPGRQVEVLLEGLNILGFEMILAIGAILMLLISLLDPKDWILKSIYIIVVSFSIFILVQTPLIGNAYLDTIEIEPNSIFLRLLYAFFFLLLIFYSKPKDLRVEYYLMLFGILLGSLFMIHARHLMLLYLAIELTSFSGYLVTSFGKNKLSYEAGIKYLVFGGTSSAAMLYGLSIVYGYQGTLYFSEFQSLGSEPFYIFGITLSIAGLMFKIGIFPFHIWVPSTYQELPPASLALISTLPKVSGIFVLLNLTEFLKLSELSWYTPVLSTLAIFTIIIGVFGAINQENVKRLFAYGAISQSGFLFSFCVISTLQDNRQLLLWYASAYALMNLLVFMAISFFEKKSLIELKDFGGLGYKNAWLGSLFVVGSISLIGLPPTAGFTAKLYLLSGLWSEYVESGFTIILVLFIVAILSTMVSLYYYLKVPTYFFLKEKSEVIITTSFLQKAGATFLTIALLGLFLFPSLLTEILNYINLRVIRLP